MASVSCNYTDYNATKQDRKWNPSVTRIWLKRPYWGQLMVSLSSRDTSEVVPQECSQMYSEDVI